MANDKWRTPPELVDYVTRRFGPIAVDLCSSGRSNAVAKAFITEDDDFLKGVPARLDGVVREGAHCFLNPPYSDPLPFVSQAVHLVRTRRVVVSGVLNHDTSVPWFRVVLSQAALVLPVIGDDRDIGRIAFIDEEGKPQISNAKTQFLFLLAPGRVRPVTEYVPIGHIYPHGRPLKRRLAKKRI